MGSCGSSLNCDQCFDYEPSRHCTNEIKANADIAGYGILIAYYFSAALLFVVIVWGWCRRSLPSYLLTSTDQYTVRFLRDVKKPFDTSDASSAQTPAQKRTSYLVTHFTKIFGDQQLISGTAILSAGLASRCDTSLLEFNIVTSFAYLCIYTHLLSLTISRDYLYKHHTVRVWRITLTICFFILFCFAYTINTVYYGSDSGAETDLNAGNVFQCIFEAPKFGKTAKPNAWYTVTVLGVLLYRYLLAIWDLFIPPETDAVTETIHSFMRHSLQETGLSEPERREVVENSFHKYYAWLRPEEATDENMKISPWYIFDVYFETYMSKIPGLFSGLAYGTVITVRSIWFTGFDISGLDKFGFGQVVALILLALTVLAVVEIINEQKVLVSEGIELDAMNSPDTAKAVPPTLRFLADALYMKLNKPLQEWFVRINVPKTEQDLHRLGTSQSAPKHYDDNPVVARRLAKACSAIWIFNIFIYTYAGLAWDFDQLEYSVVALLVSWRLFRFFLVFKRISNQMYFAEMEAETRRRNKSRSVSVSQQNLVQTNQATSGASLDSTRPSVHSSGNSSSLPTQSNAPVRTDTGHASATDSPTRSITYRATFPFPQVTPAE